MHDVLLWATFLDLQFDDLVLWNLLLDVHSDYFVLGDCLLDVYLDNLVFWYGTRLRLFLFNFDFDHLVRLYWARLLSLLFDVDTDKLIGLFRSLDVNHDRLRCGKRRWASRRRGLRLMLDVELDDLIRGCGARRRLFNVHVDLVLGGRRWQRWRRRKWAVRAGRALGAWRLRRRWNRRDHFVGRGDLLCDYNWIRPRLIIVLGHLDRLRSRRCRWENKLNRSWRLHWLLHVGNELLLLPLDGFDDFLWHVGHIGFLFFWRF